ncbi:GFA family protein [Mesorhizobium sp. IMUNJ 23232]|uniref:GFA family protein n=1 Tax=Mesorhizobium sp. IMUNJ 23232 TaxID=3376064 RepID=UPI00379155C7
MTKQTSLTCKCGQFTMQVEGPHIASVECLCNSCRKAGAVLNTLPGAAAVVDEKGATPFVMHRKDRVRILSGAEHLREYRLSAGAGTRRVIATCCNTPVFLELKGGHWLSLYGQLWTDGDRPRLEMRTMTGDLEQPANLPDDVPNLKQQSLSFYGRLFAAWVRMGFRSPKIVVNGELNV